MKEEKINLARFFLFIVIIIFLSLKTQAHGTIIVSGVEHNEGFIDVKIYIDKKNFLNEEIQQKVLSHKPMLVSISCLFSMASEVAHDVAAFVKSADTNVKVLMGGGYPTNSTKEVLQDNNLDLVIIGEGEHIPTLYGGSVVEDNANSYYNLKEVDGLLVGGASMIPEQFCKIVNNNT